MTIGNALTRNWPLVLLSVIAFGILGFVAGSLREPEWTAEARLSVGRLSLTVQSVPGFAVGGEVVAAGYARSVAVAPVIDPAARRLNVPPDDLRERVSSSAIPSSPLFDVIATGDSEAEAVASANAVADAMVEYGRAGSEAPGRAEELLRQYRDAVEREARARQTVTRLLDNGARGPRLAAARAVADTEKLRVETAAQNYRASQRSQVSGGVVESIAPARDASSDEQSRLQLFTFAGLLGGLLIGVALAVLRALRLDRRSPQA